MVGRIWTRVARGILQTSKTPKRVQYVRILSKLEPRRVIMSPSHLLSSRIMVSEDGNQRLSADDKGGRTDGNAEGRGPSVHLGNTPDNAAAGVRAGCNCGGILYTNFKVVAKTEEPD